jgi:hypothetical protein
MCFFPSAAAGTPGFSARCCPHKKTAAGFAAGGGSEFSMSKVCLLHGRASCAEANYNDVHNDSGADKHIHHDL